jgi:hypothetical protein
MQCKFLHAFSLPGLGLQCRPQLREMAVTFDLPQAGLNEAQRTGDPALFLLRCASVIHLVGELAELRIQGFQTVGGLQAHPQHWTQPQAMQGQRLLQAFAQVGHGREIGPPQLLAESAQSRPSLAYVGRS